MSLSDRYNRGEGRVQSFDKFLTELGNRVGNFWSDQTGVSRRSLTQGLYVLSALAATQHFAVSHDPTVLLFAVVALLAYMGAMPALGGVVEQIQAEAAGLPKHARDHAPLRILGGRAHVDLSDCSRIWRPDR